MTTGRAAIYTSCLCWLVACGDDAQSLRWDITFVDPTLRDATQVVRAEVWRGGCAEPPAERVHVETIGRGAAPRMDRVPDLSRGTWGFAAVAVDGSCSEVGFGCAELDLPTDRAVVTTEIAARAGAALCSPRECTAGLCAGSDAGAPPDAGPGDAGPFDAGPAVDGGVDAGLPRIDGGVDAGPPDAGPGGLDTTICDELAPRIPFLCDDFEGGRSPLWSPMMGSGATVTTTTAQRYRGAEAFHGTSPGSGSNAGLQYDVFSGVTDIYLRAYIRVPSGAAATGSVVLGVGEERTPFQAHSITITPTGIQISSTISSVFSLLGPLPRDRWICLRLHVQVGASGVLQAWIDGTRVLLRTALDTRAASPLRWGQVGLPFVPPASGATEIFADEVVFSGFPVPCD